MNRVQWTQTAALLAAALILPTALKAQAAPPKAKITPAQAAVSATQRIPGHALATKYEFEDGHWQYAVTVKNKKGEMYEAEVNSTTGKVTATERTTPAEESKEAAADKKKAGAARMGRH